MDKMIKFLKRHKSKRILSAERPNFLESDVLARYSFAVPYCVGKKVLDVGTGLGLGAEYIADKGAFYVLGIDYNKATADYLSSKIKPHNIRYIHLNAKYLYKINEKFDVILAYEVIEHLPRNEVNRFMKSLYKVLKTDGRLLMTTPNGLMTKTLFGKPYNPYHVKEYNAMEIKDILKPYFRNIEIKGMKLMNKKYQTQQKNIENRFLYKLIYVLGHYRFVREMAVYIPSSIRKVVTQERKLPNLDVSNFKLTKNLEECPGFFIFAKKKHL